MKSIFFLFIIGLSLFSISTNAQIVSGVIKDAETDEPLPYVHIGVVNKNMGTISRTDGKFDIDLSQSEKSDELVFSMLGYELMKRKIGEIKSGSFLEIKLVPKVQMLQEVIVHKKKSKPIKLGRFTPSSTTIGHNLKREFGLGGEWGLRIFTNGQKYWIENVQFHMRFNTVDSILFRIQIYSIENDMPGRSLLTHETFVTSHHNQHWIVKNLEKENLILDQDVIVSYEVVQVWFSKKTDNEIFFTYGKGYEEGKIYSRVSSMSPWQINQPAPIAIPVTMFLTVTEY